MFLGHLGFTKFECPQLWQIPGSTKLVEDVVVSLFSCLFMSQYKMHLNNQI